LPGALATRIHWAAPTRSDLLTAAVAWLLDIALFAQTLDAGPVAIVYSVLGCAVLAWRRSAPVVVFVVVWAFTLVGALALDGYWPLAALVVALYTVAATQGLRTSVLALAAALGMRAPLGVWQEWGDNPEDPRLPVALAVTGLYAVLTGGTWAVGRWARRSRHRIDDLELRRQQAAAEAVRAERRRIAHELHDIVSHSVSVMVLQARGARRVLASDPTRADEALANIEGVGKQSMVELRRLLGVLEAPTAAEPGLAPSGAGPQPGLAALPSLLDAMRLSGLTVRLVEDGAPASLDPSVDLSAYRIVQESLTNSVKHAGRDATATVHLVWAEDNLVLEVVDDGGTSHATGDVPSTQHGLPGLRERARAVGGHLEAGPTQPRGFRVTATLPLSGSAVTEPLGRAGDQP
jgi:signal transduction histidine kinase